MTDVNISSKITLRKLPMPPTANRQLIIAHGRLIKSNQARSFDKEISRWIVNNKNEVLSAKTFAERLIASGVYLRVDVEFFFPVNYIFSKTKRAKSVVKRIDVNNRLKSILDAVSIILDIDDRFFFSHFIKKKVSVDDTAFCNVTIHSFTNE